MGLTGAIYILNDEELENHISNNFSSLHSLSKNVDLSYYAIDFLDILSKYSEFERDLIGKILQGFHTFNPDDGFIGYSRSFEVYEVKTSILDKILDFKFKEYLQKGEEEGYYACSKENKEYLVNYFHGIKNAYEIAVNERKSLVFRLG
jgi:hypothetical protein